MWVEVKVNSGLNGNQIETYLQAIRDRGPELPTTLAFLTKYRIAPLPGPCEDYVGRLEDRSGVGPTDRHSCGMTLLRTWRMLG